MPTMPMPTPLQPQPERSSSSNHSNKPRSAPPLMAATRAATASTTIGMAAAALALGAAAAVLLLLAAPGAAHAQQLYKCAQPDGKTAFQDQPCHMSGSTGGTVTVKVTPPSSDALPPPLPAQTRQRPGPTQGGGTQQTADAQAAQRQQQQRQQDEFQRNARCNSARSNLGALKAQRPVFKYDNKGEKQYLDDSKRESEMAAAQRGVAENCR